MIRSPKTPYVLVCLILILILSGCELRREAGDEADAQPAGELSPPTLAPLGADSSEITETGPPTVVIVDPTATPSTLEAGAAAEVGEAAEPTAQPAVDLSAEAVGSENEAEPAGVEPESFVLPEEQPVEAEEPVSLEEEAVGSEEAVEEAIMEEVTAEEAALEEPVIANAPEDEALPEGGPIAVDPPASPVTGEYAVTAEAGTHLVRPGDTLFSISQQYGTTVENLILANGLTSEMIYEGQVLHIAAGSDRGSAAPPDNYAPAGPAGRETHVVAAGETLFGIATRYGASVEAVAGANGIAYPYTIYPGQVLNIVRYPGQPGGPSANNPYNAPGSYAAPANPYNSPDASMPPAGFANPGGFGTHTVAPGETLFSIAQRYGLTTESIAAANGIMNPNQLIVGQVLSLPR